MLLALVGRVTTNRQYRLRTYISRNGPTVHVGKCLWHSYTRSHWRTHMYSVRSIQMVLARGVHCIKKRLSFVRPMHQVRPSLPFSHTHCAQSITNLDTARDHLTHTREPDIAWRSRRAERCLSACWFLAGCNWRPRVPCE